MESWVHGWCCQLSWEFESIRDLQALGIRVGQVGIKEFMVRGLRNWCFQS